MTREDLKRASATLRALNPHLAHLFGAPIDADSARCPDVGAPLFSSVGEGMNKTEREFGLILEAMRRRGDIARYEYEGLTLRWAGMRYTPDFVVFAAGGGLKLIEVKGPHIWSRDIVRFKGARAYWPEFQFEMHQKRAGAWHRLH